MSLPFVGWKAGATWHRARSQPNRAIRAMLWDGGYGKTLLLTKSSSTGVAGRTTVLKSIITPSEMAAPIAVGETVSLLAPPSSSLLIRLLKGEGGAAE